MTYQNDIYLDTHILVWLYQSQTQRLSHAVIETLENPQNRLLISPMVLLELGFLHEIGRLNANAEQVFNTLCDVLDLQICQKSWQDTVQIAQNLTFTRDPFDRLILANAMLNNNILITKDNKISNFYDKTLW